MKIGNFPGNFPRIFTFGSFFFILVCSHFPFSLPSSERKKGAKSKSRFSFGLFSLYTALSRIALIMRRLWGISTRDISTIKVQLCRFIRDAIRKCEKLEIQWWRPMNASHSVSYRVALRKNPKEALFPSHTENWKTQTGNELSNQTSTL